MEPIEPRNENDSGLSGWILLAVVVGVLTLLAVPLWWVADTYLFGGEDAESAVTTVVGDGAATTSPEGDITSPVVNLAWLQSATGSGPGSDSAQRLVDGDDESLWNSGAYPPQAVIIELGQPSTVHTIRLRVGQRPTGETVHEVYGWRAGESEPDLLHTFAGSTRDRQWLVFRPENPIAEIERIGVGTVASPSWVAWFEIEVIGTSS